jgi:hypothetical protein
LPFAWANTTAISISTETDNGEKFALALCEFVESGAQSFEAQPKSVCLAADADPEMPWHFKEFSRYDGGLIFIPQQF